ncbi:MAG: ABC transporter ATP-binding protein [Caldilineaceae bacterium]|nr:ABC transporter ATP-binding protein [Caldilineaceae bacterium]
MASENGRPVLAVRDLEAGYGKLTILHHVTLTVPPQQFTAILGPNGSGKSTLLKTIYGFTTVTGGAIELLGESLLGVPSDQVGAHGLAYVPQRDNVFTSMTVRDNLRLAVRRLPKADAARMLDEAYRLFPILAQRGDQRAGKLSGGERQMLAIALGWLARPRIMLLDEPSAGLSPLFVTEVFRTLRQLCDESGITMVVVEQNARSILRWCDYAYVLREGQVAFQGSADDILNDEETVKGYLGVG